MHIYMYVCIYRSIKYIDDMNTDTFIMPFHLLAKQVDCASEQKCVCECACVNAYIYVRVYKYIYTHIYISA